jgi:hypothetical protein
VTLTIHMPADLVAVAKARSSDPTKRAQYERIVVGLARELKRAARAGEEEAFTDAAKRLEAEWSKLSRSQQQRVLARVGTIIERHHVKMAVATASKLEKFGRDVAAGTRRVLKDKHPNISASLTSNDRAFIGRVASSRSWYVRNRGEVVAEELRERAADIISAGARAGLSDKQVAIELAAAFKRKVVDQSEAYYRVVANAALNRARSWASLQSYREAGFESWRYASVLDERTTDTCRWLHGRTWRISTGIELLEAGEERAVRDPTSIKKTMPWITTVKDERSGESFLAFGEKGSRTRLARIDRSAVGRRDAVGSYRSMATDRELAEYGVIVPPTHGN